MSTIPSDTDVRLDREASEARRWRTFLGAFAIFFALILAWAWATPLMGSPDEVSHSVRAAAVARGELTGPSSADGASTEQLVPEFVADSGTDLACMAFKSDVSAGCQNGSSDDEPTIAYTQSTLNTPVFFAITGWPTLFLDGNIAFYAMRVIAAVISAVMLAAAFMQLRQLSGGRWAVVGLVVGVTPMTLFLAGSVNPNGMEITSAAALYSTLLLLFRQPTDSARLLFERVAFAVLAAFFLMNSRSIALLWMLLILVAALLAAKREALVPLLRKPVLWIGVGVIGLATLGAGLWYLLPKGLVQMADAPGAGMSPAYGFLTTLDRTFDEGRGWIGIFGWLDTLAPGWVYAVWAAAVLAVAVTGLALGSGRMRLLIVGWGVALLLIPPVIQAVLVKDWGIVWQGRYSMAMFVCLFITAGVALAEKSPVRSPAVRRVVTIGAWALAAAHAGAFIWALRRYVVGLKVDSTWIDMIKRADWNPPGTWYLVTAFLLLVLVVAVLAVRRVVLGTSLVRSPSVEEKAVAP